MEIVKLRNDVCVLSTINLVYTGRLPTK